jgi:hypothetical protein
VSGGLISDLKMFLSVNGLLDCVTKLRRCSGIIKLQPVWYMATWRERTPHQKCWIKWMKVQKEGTKSLAISP